jgi:3-dehydroquinate dehydratase
MAKIVLAMDKIIYATAKLREVFRRMYWTLILRQSVISGLAYGSYHIVLNQKS